MPVQNQGRGQLLAGGKGGEDYEDDSGGIVGSLEDDDLSEDADWRKISESSWARWAPATRHVLSHRRAKESDGGLQVCDGFEVAMNG